MIAFNNGRDDDFFRLSSTPEDVDEFLNNPSSPQLKGLKKLLNAILDPSFAVGSTYKDLHPLEIAKIIDHIMYGENQDNLNLTIKREADNTLSVRINIKA